MTAQRGQKIYETIIKIESLAVPPQKSIIHNELLEHFRTYKKLSEKKLQNIAEGEIDVLLETLKEIENYENIMNRFTEKFLLSEA